MKNIALIGTSKIALVHLSILQSINIKKKIYIISRSLRKAKIFIKNSEYKNFKNIIPSKIQILKEKKFYLIDICAATNQHHIFLNKINSNNSIVFIEKPLLNPDIINSKISDYLDEIYKKNKKLIVCYPFIFVANSVNKILKEIKNKKSISFTFFTSGNKNHIDIFYDLMPHAYTFICKLLNKSKIDIDNSSIKKKIYKTSFKLKFNTKVRRKISIFL